MTMTISTATVTTPCRHFKTWIHSVPPMRLVVGAALPRDLLQRQRRYGRRRFSFLDCFLVPMSCSVSWERQDVASVASAELLGESSRRRAECAPVRAAGA